MPSDPGHDWRPYFDAVRGQPARDTLLRALAFFDAELPSDSAGERFAVDLGCGTGRDTHELLRRGWRVRAIDASAWAIDELTRGAPAGELATVVAPMEAASWPACDLLNASFALPFCDPGVFPALWARVVAGLHPGGRFAGQLFGVHDEWARTPGHPARVFHERAEVDRLLSGFDVEFLDEVRRAGKDALGTPKDWHVFHIVARKRP